MRTVVRLSVRLRNQNALMRISALDGFVIEFDDCDCCWVRWRREGGRDVFRL